MDRNALHALINRRQYIVATREGGVDRNLTRYIDTSLKTVATREGGVDRNLLYCRQLRSVHGRHPRGWRG